MNPKIRKARQEGTMEKLLTVDDVARMLSVKKSTIYRWVHLRLIPFIKLGSFDRFRQRDLQRWLRSKEVKPASRARFWTQ